jgi:zinc/manganese transport system permease protein
MDIAFDLMKWPVAACVLLPGLLVYYGLHVVRRQIIFVDLALAQVSALGTCICVMLGHAEGELHTFIWSFGFTLIGAAIFTATRSVAHPRVPQEALIGVVYVVAAAAAILLLSRSTEGNEVLKRTLIGDVLTVSWDDLWKTSLLYLGIAAVHWVFRRQFLALSFQAGEIGQAGLPVRRWDFFFYALFGLVVTSFVHIGGVLLTFSYLIVPAVCANLLAQRLGAMLLAGWALATVCSLAGIGFSYQFDLPTGAAVVCALGLALAGVLLALRRKPRIPA